MAKPRRIGVLTFHRCINYGSYWQARCLAEGLRRRGHESVLLDHRSAQVDRAEWRCALQPTLPTPTPPEDLPLYAAKTRKFFEAFEDLPMTGPFDLEAGRAPDGFDAVVVGSDEVWNFRHPWYAGRPLFFGEGIETDRLVAYAASFGNHDAGDGVDPFWAARLKGFSAIAVRDDNSRRLIETGLGRDPEIVLDPCLQFDALSRRPGEPWPDRAIVYGHSFAGWFKAAVRRWADARGVRLVSLGYRNDWADEQWIAAGPEEFARAMASARAVITNFFHGCVFALVNARPFVSALADYRVNKVRDLTARVGAERRLVGAETPQWAVAAALDEPLGPRVEDRLDQLRRRSEAYLDLALA
ncbi:polysaccharide pyruvyl transferase family protein [Brevundimonas sp.]|uniref:polysaccharide pyruvyl transferase family protein n=1 Tax=Brevundimonas sp. TaxID=1871086 RepID=UPI002D5D8706|nr:polysaccharide pyruvyl transferase family protein [Brevundimonas sp.]HYC67083.1 polysaccharide pyruvyl transferase family protein [Brevundimonas sp.]